MTAPVDSSIPTKVSSIDWNLFNFCFWEYYENLLRKCLKMKIFSLFIIVYSKTNMNVVSTIGFPR